jgi:hypothetical protein
MDGGVIKWGEVLIIEKKISVERCGFKTLSGLGHRLGGLFNVSERRMNTEDIFVFGSNEQGIHGKGAALYAAKKWGAIKGIGSGRQGLAYAIPTKSTPRHTLPLEKVSSYVLEFIAYAKGHPANRFLVSKIGCGLAGFSEAEISPLFKDAPANVFLINEAGEPMFPAREWSARL